MIKAYINYPNPHITVHSDPDCPRIKQHHKKDQRVVHLDVTTMASELKCFEMKRYQFGAHREINDMWLEVDFRDTTYALAVIENIRKLLAEHYAPFRRVEIDKHC
jgi:hypothetical protein